MEGEQTARRLVDPENLINRARERCTRHRDVPGFCSGCFQWVMAEMLVEENRELCMDDAINVVLRWMLATADAN